MTQQTITRSLETVLRELGAVCGDDDDRWCY